jgi:alkaline phosphatase
MKRDVFILVVLGIFGFTTWLSSPAFARDTHNKEKTGNAIFIHPDGTGLNHFLLTRHYWSSEGPDGSLQWDKLPTMAWVGRRANFRSLN